MIVENEKRIKICYAVSSLSREGPVNVLLNIIRYLSNEKYEIFIITLKNEGDNTMIEEFKNLDVEIVQLNIKSKLFNIPKLVIAFKKEFLRISPQIIHSHCPRSLFLSSIMKMKIIKFHTLHNLPGMVDKALYGKLKGTIVAKFVLFTIKRIPKPISCSKSISDDLKKNYKLNIQSIQNGSDFKISEIDDKQCIRNKLGLEKNKKYFIYVGRFSKEKNPWFLIKLFEKIKDKNVELIMLGDGPLLENIKTKKLRNVKIIGFTKEVRNYLIASDYFISSSISEGMPNSVIEAMSIGLPLLLSNIPAHREILLGSNIEIGLLYNFNNESDFFNKYNKIQCKSFIKTNKSIKQYYEAKYSAKTMSEKYQIEYNKCLERFVI